MEFLTRGRWFFDPARGLARSCKNPQKPDTALKKFWTQERLQNPSAFGDESVISEEADSQAAEEGAPVKKKRKQSGKAAVKKAGKGKKKPALKRGRKAKKAIPSEPDEESESEEENLPPTPPPQKRPSRAKGATENADSSKDTEQAQSAPLPLVNKERRDNIATLQSQSSAGQQKMVSFRQYDSSMSEKSFFVPPAEGTLTGAAPMSAELFNMFISTAYDTAALNARAQELARREQLCHYKEREMADREAKAQFMASMAQASGYFQNNHRFP